MAAQQMERLEAETTIPSLRGSALFGNFLGYRRDPIAFYMGLGWSGDISSYRMLTAPVVFINEPRLIQSLLVERAADYDKGKLQRYLFRPDAERALPRYAYLPFGAGHRVCIGSHFATMEGHLLLATVARTLRFTLAESATPVAPELVLTLRPSRPIMVTAMRR